MVIKPWVLALVGCFVAVMLIGHLLATTYLVVRDDLMGASMARQARMQHTYEDRIAKLRYELDRATSRQLLNQQLVQDKVAELMQRQETLSSRHGQLSPILSRAGIYDGLTDNVPVPGPSRNEGRDEKAQLNGHDVINSISNDIDTHGEKNIRQSQILNTAEPNYASAFTATRPASSTSISTSSSSGSLAAYNTNRADKLFGNVALSLENIEQEQINRIQLLAQNTKRKTEEIKRILKGSALPSPSLAGSNTDASAIGGPFLPAKEDELFSYSLRGLDEALQNFDHVLNHVENLPINNPVVGAQISSRFGSRRDPFLKRRAFHAGIDFKAKTGTSVKSVAKGKVIAAGWKGGYGKMVEVDHGNGMTTRYAHLSRISVNVGQHVSASSTVGSVGSTGRSTGPHLHYEIRKNGKPVNPANYINAGMKLRPLIDSL